MYNDPHENYCRLQRTTKFLQTGGRITEDWIEEHRRHVRKYCEIFWNMSEFHPEITDPTFRQKAKEVEVLLEYLRITFDVRGYFQLNQDLIQMTEILMTEDDLLACMNLLSI
jgi:hypothetical protein